MRFDSLGKRKVRQEWNTPLIRKLAESHSVKYHYFGLPGIEALDLVLWQQYIESVTAFEAPDDPRSGTGSGNAAKLELKLVELGFEPRCYAGFLENVIQTKVDNRGRKFIPDKFYTLLNLDFCSHLTSRTLVDQAKVTARYDTLGRIAAMQRDLWKSDGICGSIWLITLRTEVALSGYQLWRTNLDDQILGEWVDSYNDRDRVYRGNVLFFNPFKLKAFLYKTIKAALDGVRFSSYWYPMLLYQGNSPSSRMAHFMILCHANHIGNPVPVPLQTMEDFLKDNILQVKDGRLINYETNNEIMSPS